jgi:hypothetical protein
MPLTGAWQSDPCGLERLHRGVGLRAEDSIDRDRVTACLQQILQRPDRVDRSTRGSDGARLVIGHPSIEADCRS